MNASTTDDDEWETADLNVGKITLVEQPIVKSKPAFIMPARLMNRDTIGDINFFPPVVSQTSSSNNQGSFGIPFSTGAVADPTEQVDSALLNAIENPRERMQVLNLENILLLFVKSSERSMELPPEHNSFRRLLTYRIAQRFGLTHAAVSDPSNENEERGILIYRTSDTRVPSPLLIDLPPPSEGPSDQSPFGSSQNLAEVSAGDATTPVVKKMTMMKRNPNRDNDIKKQSTKKEKQTPEEREKAYAEARARIFGAEAEAAASAAALSAGSTGSLPLKKSTSDGKLEKEKTVVATTQSRTGNASPPSPASAMTSVKKKAPSNTGKKSPSLESGSVNGKLTPDQLRSATSASPPTIDSASDSGKGRKKTVDVTTWKEKKFTVRDQDAERSDPDFSRRNVHSTVGGRGASQHTQYAQSSQYRSPDEPLAGYQGQGVNGMAPGPTYQQGYQLPQDPYPYGQNSNGMIPYGPQGIHNPYGQGSFAMQMGHMGMSNAPGSPPHPQQQWQQALPQGMIMAQHQGNPYYPHLAAGGNMAAIHPPLGPGPLSMGIGMYGQIQGIGPVQGGYGTGPYGPLGGLYPPLPTSSNVSGNTYSSLSTEQHQSPPSV